MVPEVSVHTHLLHGLSVLGRLPKCSINLLRRGNLLMLFVTDARNLIIYILTRLIMWWKWILNGRGVVSWIADGQLFHLLFFQHLLINGLCHERQYEVLDVWKLLISSFDWYKCLIRAHCMQFLICFLMIIIDKRSVLYPSLSVGINPFFFLREYGFLNSFNFVPH